MLLKRPLGPTWRPCSPPLSLLIHHAPQDLPGSRARVSDEDRATQNGDHAHGSVDGESIVCVA